MNPLQDLACDEQDRRSSLSLTDRSTGLNAGEACGTVKVVDPECAELLHGLNNVLVGTEAVALESRRPTTPSLLKNRKKVPHTPV